MSSEFTLDAAKRDVKGKGASRRLRRIEGKIPGIIYGGGADPVSITLLHHKLVHALENEAFYSHVLTLNVDGKAESVILKDLQRHPFKPTILHADFLRIKKDQKLHVNVPIHFINETTCVGVKLEGGAISHLATEVAVTCLPGDLPEYIEIDMAEVSIDEIVHLSDIKAPKGVEISELAKGADHDQAIATVHKLKGAKADEESEDEEGESVE